MAAAVLFPPEIFVDHLLVAVRDAALRLPGSSLPYHRHARQAAALAAADANASDALVAAALLSGIGEVILTSFARHPAADGDVTRSGLHAAEVARSHLSLHFPEAVTEPIALLPRARRYLRDARRAPSGAPAMDALERARFESEAFAVDATTLAVIDERAGRCPMVCPPLDAHRDLLYRLCAGTNRTPRLRLIS